MPAKRQTRHIDFDRRHLKDIVAQADSLFGARKGLRVVLAGGQPADRNLVAAQLARRRGARLERVDLAAVTADGMAQTAKALSEAFAQASTLDVVLFFDEADALFGRRTDVADSHDRYARTKSKFLSALAAYKGVVVVAMSDAPGRFPDLKDRADIEIRFAPPWPPPSARVEIEPRFTRPLSNLHFLVVIGDSGNWLLSGQRFRQRTRGSGRAKRWQTRRAEL